MLRQASNRRRRGSSDFALMVVFLALFGALAGLSLGADFGAQWGNWGKLIGGLAGLIAGFIATVLGSCLLYVALFPLELLLEWIGRWSRPYPPVCKNGTCMKPTDYRRCEIPGAVADRVKGLCRSGHRCRCGDVYATGYDYGTQRRFICVLPDGTIRPYLRFRPFGRWRPDDGRGIVEIVPGAQSERPPRETPGWTIPCICTALVGGIAFYVVYLSGEVEPHPIGPWFVLAAAAVGLVSGLVGWWIVARQNHKT